MLRPAASANFGFTARIDSETGLGLEEHADYKAGQQQKQYHTGGYGNFAYIEGQEVGNYLVRGKAVHLYGLAEAVAQHPAHFAVGEGKRQPEYVEECHDGEAGRWLWSFQRP